MQTSIRKITMQMSRLNQQGYTLVAALVFLAILVIFLAMSVPLWSKVKQRDNEQELIFRGQEYMEAIGRYHAKFGAFPPDLETLQKLKFIRKLYPDPMTKSGKWKVLHPDSLVATGAAGTIGASGTQPPLNEQEQNQHGDQREENKRAGADHNKEADKQEPGLENKEDEKSDEEPEVESKGPVVGVVSRSKKESMKIYNGQNAYNKWVFVYAVSQQPTQPGQPGQPGQPPPPGTPGGKQPEVQKNPKTPQEPQNDPDPDDDPSDPDD
jgi:type II secretory pathway pseudopilin PulG